jgi:hypothetical protein
MRSLAGFFVVAALCVSTGSVVVAAPSTENPEALIGIGNDLRRKGDDARAEGYFERAYELAHTPRSAAQLGLVELALKHYVQSEAHLSEALDRDDSWVHAHAKTLEDSRATARKHLLGITIAGATRDATANFGSGNVVPLGKDGVIWVAPGAVSFEVQAIGHKSATVSVSGGEGDMRQVAVEMPAIEAPHPELTQKPPEVKEPEAGLTSTEPRQHHDEGVPTTSSNPGRGLKIAGITTASVGLVAGVVGAVVFSAGNAKRDRYSDPSTPYNPSDANYKSEQSAGVALLIGGGVALVGGAVMYLVGARSTNDGSTVGLNVGSDFGLIEWKGRF